MSFYNYNERTFYFKEKLSVYKVDEIKKLLLESYRREENKNQNFYLDLNEVESIDSAVFQIFISLKKVIEANMGKLELKRSCQTFDALLDLLGAKF